MRFTWASEDLPQIAYWTHERLLPCMDSHVGYKSSFFVKLFVAQFTWVNEFSAVLILTHPSLVSVSTRKVSLDRQGKAGLSCS